MTLHTPAPLERVLVVDDHPFFSRGLAEALLQSGRVRRVDTTDRLSGAIEDLRRYPDTDLVMLDLKLPDDHGMRLLEHLEMQGLPIPVVIVSSREDEGALRAARDAGALGYLPKSASPQTLRRMLLHVQRGEPWFTPPERTRPEDTLLTPRQRDVLQLLADGLPNKRICEQLGLTEHTVKTHLKTIYTLLDVHNRTTAVAVARDRGLVN